jgi:tetratricopeptide (TPR) repeat protein
MRHCVDRCLAAGAGLRKLQICGALGWLAFGFTASATAQTAAAKAERDHAAGKPHRHVPKQAPARSAAAVTDPRGQLDAMPQRTAMLQRAEAELLRGDAAAAIESFDRAAMMLHAPDTEMGLVRAYMQAGEYRRALAFCAHTAGAHREAAAPGALYAWLLQAGGQNEQAQRTLKEALGRHPSDVVLLQAQATLATRQPVTNALLLAGSHRLAPQPVMQAGLPAPTNAARVVSSGVLLPTAAGAAQHALVPLHAVQDASALWLRNGLGQTTQAEVAQRFEDHGVALLRLLADLPVGDVDAALIAAPQDPFGGSPGYVVAFSNSASSDAAWPWLHAGFHGAAARSGDRPLGIDVPALSSGGLVLDSTGRLAGIALQGAQNKSVLLPISTLRSALPSASFSADATPTPASAAATRMSADKAYERALRWSLQVIAAQP